MWEIGSDTVQIVKRSNSASRDRLNRKIPAADESITISGCVFEVDQPTENEDSTVVDTTRARVFMPVSANSKALQPTDAIRYDGRDYELRGPRVLEKDFDGLEDHVWCSVEWQHG